MNSSPFPDFIPRLRRMLAPRSVGSDAELLAQFAATRDESAFAELIARHGPLVRGVCRRVLGPDAADDAFQATFLVLARKASSIRRPAAVGSWLYGVAYHLSRQAKTGGERRSKYERRVIVSEASSHDPPSAAAWAELLAVLDEELAKLPDRLRGSLLLCYIDGRTQDEAAKQLGWSLGTFRRRLDRARDLLRLRMERRGATLSAGLFATLLAADAVTAAVPASLAHATTTTAMAFIAGAAVSPSIAALAHGGLHMLSFPKVTATAFVALLLGGLTVGAGVWLGPDAKKADNAKPSQAAEGPPLLGGAIARLGEVKFNHGAAISNVLVAHDGRTILTQGERSVRIWDAQTGQDLGGVDVPDDGPNFWTSSLTPDGKTLLTTRYNGTAQVWNLADRKLVRSFALAAPPFDLAARGPTARSTAVHAPDGSAIAVVTADGSLRVCDVASGREREDLRSHSDSLTAVGFTTDSKQMLLVSHGGVMRFRDIVSGQNTNPPTVSQAGNFVIGDRLPVFTSDTNVSGTRANALTVMLTPNGQPTAAIIAAPADAKDRDQGSSYLYFYTWRAAGKGDARFLGDAGDPLAFTPDSRYLLARDPRSNYLGQWDLASGRNMRQYPIDLEPVRALAFTHDGRTLITGDQRLQFWDWKRGQLVDKQDAVANTPIPARSFVLTPDGQSAVIAESDGRLTIRELANNRVVRRFEPTGVPAGKSVALQALALSGNGERVAAIGKITPPDEPNNPMYSVWVWDFATGQFQYRLAALNYQWLAFSPDAQTLIASSTLHDHPSRVWDMTTGQERLDYPIEVPSGVIDFARDGPKMLAFEPQQGSIKVLSPDGKTVFENWRDSGFARSPRCWAYTPDFKMFAFGWVSNTSKYGITVFKGPKLRLPPVAVRGLKEFPTQMALSADGLRLAGTSYGETPEITLWDVATGRELKRYTGLRGQARGVAFTPDGRRLVAASTDGTLLVWEVPD